MKQRPYDQAKLARATVPPTNKHNYLYL